MLTFEQLTKKLVQGQLKNTPVKKKDTIDEVDQDYVDTLLMLTNEGLKDITSKMPVITRQIDLTFVDGQNVYEMSESNVGGFLNNTETGDDFADDMFVGILDIFDQYGDRHPHDTKGHILTPTYRTLRFTTDKMAELGEKVRIRYQAKHNDIVATDSIDLPPNLETALQLFVASLYLSHMNGEQHSKRGDQYFAAYLRHLGEDEARNISGVSEVQSDTRFQDRGFV